MKISNSLKIKDLFTNELNIEYAIRGKDELPPIDELNICRNDEYKYYDGISSFYYYTFKNECPVCGAETTPMNRIRIKMTPEIHKIIDKIERKANLNFLNSVDFPKLVRGEEDVGLVRVKEGLKDHAEENCIFLDAKEDFKYYFYEKNQSFNIDDISSKVLKGSGYEYYKNPKLLIKHNNIVPEAIYTE